MTTETTTPLPTTPLVQRPDEAPTYSMSPTEQMRFLFSGAVGQPEFYEERVARGDGPPLHRHAWATWEYLIEGELRVVIDDEELRVAAGDFFYTPPNATHTYVVESDTARIIGFNHPGGHFEDLNREVAPMFLEPGGPDMQAVVERAAAHGVEILGPPLGAET
ncbi:MAG: cupin domain-containing protein [Acidimicrobiia bacterium]|nr:cupin domain-containing protein [Acidimicrobiia bacterium]